MPATFLRLSACNLRCRYCDTPYTWDYERFDVKGETASLTIEETLERLLVRAPTRIVITGGEPLLQQKVIPALLERLSPAIAVEVETNGTILPEAGLLRRVSQWNVSPKLAFSGLASDERIVMQVLRAFAGTESAYLKLVVAEPTDMQEGDRIIQDSGWASERVVWMPEGTSAQRLMLRSRWLAEQAVSRKQRFSTRLQVLLWGDQRGR